MEQTPDYSELTSLELNTLIAKRLGWYAVEINGLWFVCADEYAEWVIRKVASTHMQAQLGKSSEEAAFAYCKAAGFAASTDLALSLFKDEPISNLYLNYSPDGEILDKMRRKWRAYVSVWNTIPAEAYADSASLAVCLCWLAWKDSNEE